MCKSQPSNLVKFNGFKILSIDYGKKVVGLAMTHPGTELFPMPSGRILYKNDLQVAQDIKLIIDSESIDFLILGLPKYEDGNESKMTKIVLEFSSILKKLIGDKEVYFQDETYTSYEAKERMKNSPQYHFKVNLKQVDALAACIILEDFLKL